MPFSKIIYSFFLMGMLFACQKQGEKAAPQEDTTRVNSVQIQADSVTLIPNEGLVYFKGKPFSGTTVSYYNHGNLASQTDYQNGKKHGLYKKWFESGQISYESNYVLGKQDGLTYSWWQNGNKRSSSNFSDGIPDGKQLQWYSSGAKFKSINLVKGREEGLQQSWRENGKVYNNYEAKNGRIFGLKRANLCYQLDDEIIQYKD